MTTSYEVDKSSITAQDFAVQLKTLPAHQSVRELKASLWCWVYNILEREYKNFHSPQNGSLDDNQNAIMNINFGLSEYGRFKYMINISNFLKNKKRFDRLEKEHRENREYYQMKIDVLQNNAKKELFKMEEYSKQNPSRAVIAFIQFQSNNGKEKFIKAYKKGPCQRCCNYERHKHKYIDGKWPKVSEAPDPSVIIWQNLAIGKCSRFFRSLGVWILSILIMLLSLVVIIVNRYFQSRFNTNFTTTNCGDIQITK